MEFGVWFLKFEFFPDTARNAPRSLERNPDSVSSTSVRLAPLAAGADYLPKRFERPRLTCHKNLVTNVAGSQPWTSYLGDTGVNSVNPRPNKLMKTKSFAVVALLLLCVFNSPLSTAHAQGTAFTYQGRLTASGSPANGSYDLQFGLWNGASGAEQLGSTVSNPATAVSNGVFTVTLDFGANFSGADRWLEIGVRAHGGGVYNTLSPRQQLTPSPYAITAGAVTGVVPAEQISGTIPVGQLPATVVVNGASGVNLSGTFSGNGAGITGVNLALNSGGAIASSGGFLLSSSPSVGSQPQSVAAADINGDGKTDLISANRSPNTLSVMTNNGSGGFALSSSPSVGDPLSINQQRQW
jgi:hypothetical protein